MTTNRNYANRNLQNSSFKGQNLTGADFSDSDLRGCDFTGANLVGASFERVKTGQSRRQIVILIAAAIVGPVVLIGFSVLAAHLSLLWFTQSSNQVVNFFLGAVPILALMFGNYIRHYIASRFPQITMFLNIAAMAVLFAVMVTLTVGLAIVSILSFGDGAIAQGFFLLLLMVVWAFLSFHILKWLLEAIFSYPGTNFRKSNLTNANFSHSLIQNTDFSLAVLTGVCIFNWEIKPYTQFTNVYCEYLYLEPAHQNRRPEEGNLQPNELEHLLTQFRE